MRVINEIYAFLCGELNIYVFLCLGRFTEDGSFIGQYIPSNMRPMSGGSNAAGNQTSITSAVSPPTTVATYV